MPSDLSREFDITAQSIANWVGQAVTDSGKPLSATAPRLQLP